jgi:hydrogenase/urease accessory protein HupE
MAFWKNRAAHRGRGDFNRRHHFPDRGAEVKTVETQRRRILNHDDTTTPRNLKARVVSLCRCGFSSLPLRLCASAALFGALSSKAEAHLVTTGLGPVYDGIGHFFLSPDDLCPVLALALFAGLRGAKTGRWVLFIVPVAWLVGGLIGQRSGVDAPRFAIPALSFLILGILVATDLRLSAIGVAVLGIGLGLLHGFLNGITLPPGGDGALALIGIAATLFVFVTLVAAFVVSLRLAWTRIAVRVAGSWIAAIGLLMLGWSLHQAK